MIEAVGMSGVAAMHLFTHVQMHTGLQVLFLQVPSACKLSADNQCTYRHYPYSQGVAGARSLSWPVPPVYVCIDCAYVHRTFTGNRPGQGANQVPSTGNQLRCRPLPSPALRGKKQERKKQDLITRQPRYHEA